MCPEAEAISQCAARNIHSNRNTGATQLCITLNLINEVLCLRKRIEDLHVCVQAMKERKKTKKGKEADQEDKMEHSIDNQQRGTSIWI